jgi:hypothetical protein
MVLDWYLHAERNQEGFEKGRCTYITEMFGNKKMKGTIPADKTKWQLTGE